MFPQSLRHGLPLVCAAAGLLLTGCSSEPVGLAPALDPSQPDLSTHPGELFRVVTVRQDAPAPAAGALVNNLADAVARVRSGGTIRVHPGTYLTRGVDVTKSVTIEGTGSRRPVIDAGNMAFSFRIGDMESGSVVLRGLEFRNATHNSVFINGQYDRVTIENSEFHPGSGPKTNGILGYYSGIMAWMARGNAALIQNNTFTGGDIGVHTNDAIGVVVLNNVFTNQDNAAIHDGNGGGVHAEGNTIHGCGPYWCIGVFGGGAVSLVRNTINVDFSRPVVNGIQVHGGEYRIEGNVVTGTGGTRDPSDAFTWPIQSNAIAVDGTATASGNRLAGAHNGFGFGNVVVSGSDNVVTAVGSVLNIYQATVNLHSSDFSGYARALQFVHEPGTSSLTCNWWGSASGPQNVDPGVDPNLYRPWATAEVANGAGGACNGGF